MKRTEDPAGTRARDWVVVVAVSSLTVISNTLGMYRERITKLIGINVIS